MKLRVTHIEERPDFATVAVAVGQDDEGNEWRFAGDWRSMEFLRTIVDEEPEVEVESWQLLGRYRLQPVEPVVE